MRLSKQQHLDGAAPTKRILSLDGGGIRGILTLQYLKAIETMLRKRFNDESLLLCDYFDLIGGTSTGSIIAAGLACGKSVDELQKLYTDLGASVFQPGAVRKWLPSPLQGKFVSKFPSGPLEEQLNEVLGADTPLGSDDIRTGLMIMTKRLDTGSPWPLNNCGRGKYAAQDGALRLARVVRASTAAPTYFDPEEIQIQSRDGAAVDAVFVDGGVTPFNDPALRFSCWPRCRVTAFAGQRARIACFWSPSGRVATSRPTRREISSARWPPCRASRRCNRSWTIASA